MTAPLTHAEAMARLAACVPMKRGERLAEFCESEAKWSRERYPLFLTLMTNHYGHMPHGPSGAEFRRVAAPLRRAREQRMEARAACYACHRKNRLLRSVLMSALLHIDDENTGVAAALRARLKDGE